MDPDPENSTGMCHVDHDLWANSVRESGEQEL